MSARPGDLKIYTDPRWPEVETVMVVIGENAGYAFVLPCERDDLDMGTNEAIRSYRRLALSGKCACGAIGGVVETHGDLSVSVSEPHRGGCALLSVLAQQYIARTTAEHLPKIAAIANGGDAA